MGIGIFSCFGVSNETASEVELFFLAVAVFYAFYFSHWEKYTTNVMYLPWAYDVSQFVSIYFKLFALCFCRCFNCVFGEYVMLNFIYLLFE